MRLRGDEAVSTAYSYVLMFAIATILFTSIMLTFQSATDRAEERAVRQELEAVGHQVAQFLVDSSTSGVQDGFVRRNFDLPRTVAGQTYTVTVNGSRGKIIMEASGGETVLVPINGLENSSRFSGTLYSTSFQSSQQPPSTGFLR